MSSVDLEATAARNRGVQEADPLLAGSDATWPRTRVVLSSPVVKFVTDWGALVLFYALESSLVEPEKFGTAAVAALSLGSLSMAVTQFRACIDKNVASPKVLDVGFVVSFSAFTVAGYASSSTAKFAYMWCNALMDAALAFIVLIGVAMGSPFVLQCVSNT